MIERTLLVPLGKVHFLRFDHQILNEGDSERVEAERSRVSVWRGRLKREQRAKTLTGSKEVVLVVLIRRQKLGEVGVGAEAATKCRLELCRNARRQVLWLTEQKQKRRIRESTKICLVADATRCLF